MASANIGAMTDLPETTISELLQAIAQGDEKAVTRLYRHYYGFVYAYARHKLNNDADAEEVAADTLLAVCRKPDSYSGQARFSTWLCSIAKFKAIDFIRRDARHVDTEPIDDSIAESHAAPNWDFVDSMVQAEDEEALRLCRDRLPEEQREALFWVFYQGDSVETVAERQGCPEGTVKSRLFNARKRLKDCLTRWIQGGRYA